MSRNTQHVSRFTSHVTGSVRSRITYHASHLPSSLAHLNPDTLIGFFLFLAGLYGYTATLAPTVIEGDAALFQYTPYVLGVTYPTGFPFYILLGKIWLTLFPFGEIAWRMNIFSALCSATALPLIYAAARRLYTSPSPPSLEREDKREWPTRWAALLTVLVFATIPTFWRWSTEAKTYALNILLFSGLLYTLARALETRQHPPTPIPQATSRRAIPLLTFFRFTLPRWLGQFPLALPSLLLGFQISVHNTGLLLVPGLFVMAWLHFRNCLRHGKSVIIYLLLLMTPSLFYLYVPLRAEWLIARYSRPEAIERGLLADFYHSGLAGLIRYFTATGFTGGVVTNWGLVPGQFFTVYIPLLTDDLTSLGVGLGIIGGLAFAITQPRRFLPLFLMYAVPIPFVLVYGQGEQSAFLLPSFLIFSFFAGYTLILIDQSLTKLTHLRSRIAFYLSRFTLPLLLLILIPFLFLPQIRHNVNWLTIKWNRAIYDEWADALAHPLEPGAGMLAHWGDLTSFWYMQHAEGRRPDLRGVYPPTEATVTDWYKRGNSDLYIAGPLQGWAAGVEHRYQLIPWGRLVRIASRQVDPRSLLPTPSQPVEVTFDSKLHLIGVDHAPQAVAGRDYPLTLTWQALEELPRETTVSLRLSQGDAIVAQLDDRLRSGWFPSDALPAGQHVLSYALMPVPLGTLPGEYRLQLVTYTNDRHPWTLPDGTVMLDLGLVEIMSPPPDYQPEITEFKPLPRHDFNGEIKLMGYNYTVSRVGQGKGFGIELLWQAQTNPADNYTLLAEAIDAAGNVLRAMEHQPVDGRAPTGSWQAGQFIRDQVDMVVPASAPPGQQALRVRLSWRRPDGSKLNLRRWWLPIDDGLALGSLNVTEKRERVFDPPQVQYTLNANLENKVRLIGYNALSPGESDLQPNFQFNRPDCASAEAEACKINLEFYWQGLSEMESLYQVFLHVIDPQGQIVAQHDRVPGKNGKQPTTGWLPGEVVADPIELSLPPNIAAGQYTIRLGMYLSPDGPRLRIFDKEGQPTSDFVEVGTITITPQ